jgi:hypothetical protein
MEDGGDRRDAVVKEIRIYVEGGGDKDSKARLRQPLSNFLGELRNQAQSRRIGWTIVACGSRTDTYDNFRLALMNHPQAFNLMLVDAERPVVGAPREHLSAPEDGWDLRDVGDEQCQLMVEMMEAWLVADAKALAAFYGDGFRASALPRNRNVEQIAKADLESALKKATSGTRKGEYHKTRHGPPILEKTDPALVRSHAPHCERLFGTLQQAIAS